MPGRIQSVDYEADLTETPPATFTEAFAAAMPSRYRLLFDARAIWRHASVSFRRAGRPAYAEVWRSIPDGSAALCIVADDRPGLLSVIAAALVSHRLDVITALVFSRTTSDDGAEAVDFFWVKRTEPSDTAPIDAGEAASIGHVLSALLTGSISVDAISLRPSALPASQRAPVVVRFEDADDNGLAVLVVEAPDRPGMLLTITRELFRHGAQIIRSLVRTADGRVFNRFELAEFSSAPLAADRREQIASGVLAVVAWHEAREIPEEPAGH